MADDENTPNEEISLRDQYAQYAFGRTVSEVMTNPERDVSEITAAAARAGMDVILGEEHDLTEETLRQMRAVMEAVPADQIKAIIMEAPLEYQEFYEPSFIEGTTFGEFVRYVINADLTSQYNTMKDMVLDETITMDEYDWYGDRNLMPLFEDVSNLSNEELEAEYGDLLRGDFEMLRDAAERGIPVIAADVDRRRIILGDLAVSPPPDMQISPEDYRARLMEAAKTFAAELDDSSDLGYLHSLGFNTSEPGILLIHRGQSHITGIRPKGVPEGEELPPTKGFDDLLEERGRHVLTVSVVPDIMRDGMPHFEITDPTDLNIYVHPDGQSELDRDDYAPPQDEPSEQPATGVIAPDPMRQI